MTLKELSRRTILIVTIMAVILGLRVNYYGTIEYFTT